MESLRECDSGQCRDPALLREVNNSGSERQLDLNKRLIAVGQQILGFTRIDTDHSE